MSHCRICRLPKADHGPHRNGLVYADPYGWHTYTSDHTTLTGAPPPDSPRRAAAAAATAPRISVHPVDADSLALFFGTDVARQATTARTSLPHRVPGASLNPPPAARWWHRLLGGTR
ncbi:hypothetical protein Q7689_00610 [Nocardiopsis tropica]|uniref:hypothetical protein n=1 Tax=Nocardiopsis tropica TaxID=109330 RepID=UPI002E8A0C10|nr:hypothetical protein [Nocardiopsis tropica]